MSTEFASVADLEEKEVTFVQLSEHCWAFTTEGDPNTGIIIGDDSVMIIDATATPVAAQDVIKKVREITDKPIKYVVLTHYHAVRVLGVSGYKEEGLEQVIASQNTYELIVERGQQDMDSEISRFPRLFKDVGSIPGLTWPTMTFTDQMTLMMGDLKVQIQHPGRGHTKGDTIVWVESEKVLYSGDLVEFGAACYTGDAYLTNWPETLDKLAELGAEKLVPGRGPALETVEQVEQGLSYTRNFVTALFDSAKKSVEQNLDLKGAMAVAREMMDPDFGHVFIYEHCLPFDVTRANDEARGIVDPQIWTAERDQEMWHGLQQEQPK